MKESVMVHNIRRLYWYTIHLFVL